MDVSKEVPLKKKTIAEKEQTPINSCKEFVVLEEEKSNQTTSLDNARRQHEPEDTILREQENTVHTESDSSGACKHISSQLDPDLDVSNVSDNELVTSPVVPVVSSPEREPCLDCLVFRDTTDDYNSPDYCGNCMNKKVEFRRCTDCKFISIAAKIVKENIRRLIKFYSRPFEASRNYSNFDT